MNTHEIEASRARLDELDAEIDAMTAPMAPMNDANKGRALSAGQQQRWDQLSAAVKTRQTEYRELDAAAEVKQIVETNEAELTRVERTVIFHRFGLAGEKDTTPLTLEQVGQIIGVTKERVRQIQNKALEKIRLAIEENAKREEGEPEAEVGVTDN